MSKKLIIDIAERTAWTLAQVGVAFVIANQASLPAQYVIYITPVLAVLKGIIAKNVGNPNDASINPFAKSVADNVATVAQTVLEKEVAPKLKKAASAPVKKAAPAKKAPAKKTAK